MRCKVVFQPDGRQLEVEAGRTILEAARLVGLSIETACGGQRRCGKCKVKIQEGNFSHLGLLSHPDHLAPLTEEEQRLLDLGEQRDHYRLACAAVIRGDLLVIVPEQSSLSGQIVRKDIQLRLEEVAPAVSQHRVVLEPPSLRDSKSDLERLLEALEIDHGLGELSIDPLVLAELPKTLRSCNWEVMVTVWQQREVQRVGPARQEPLLGLAIDIGTTTVAGYLCDLGEGRILATSSLMNPQVTYGDDVMSRISYIQDNPAALGQLHAEIIEAINQIASQATQQIGAAPDQISEMAVVGNTVMHHLFLGITPEYIGLSPFAVALQRSLNIKARDLGLNIAPTANVYVLPVEAGFVGADNVGVIIHQEPHNRPEVSLIIDIGTNGELVLGNRERLLSASCATGPAFEGAHIRWGMRAAPGAIERVRIDPETYEVDYQVIPDPHSPSTTKPRGICGSGIIDAIAQMLRANIIGQNGTFNTSLGISRLRKVGNKWEFVIALAEETAVGEDITITIEDIRAVQLAKGALYAGTQVLLRKWGIPIPDRIVLAGAFGTYIDKVEAMRMGLFPTIDLAKVESVGNAAGLGACLALCDQRKRTEAEEIARKVEYVELSLEPEFEREFMKAMYFPSSLEEVRVDL